MKGLTVQTQLEHHKIILRKSDLIVGSSSVNNLKGDQKMWLKNPDKLKELLYRMVKIPSISGTKKEKHMAEEVYSILTEIPYFQTNKKYLTMHTIPGDEFERAYVTALLKGSGSKTVILLQHFDVIDIQDYGNLKAFACDIDAITEKITHFELPEEAQNDLKSGEWIFGRGVMDMKAGAALQIALMHDYSQHIEELDGNILLVSTPDEENNSKGIASAIPYLLKLKEEHDLDYVSVINSESHSKDAEGRHNIAIGSIGKALALFYCFGKEAHGGSPFEGLNSSLIFAQVASLMEKNTNFCDEFEDEVTPPPVNLKSGNLRGVYSVTTPQVTTGFYNILIINSSTRILLNKMTQVAQKALEKAIDIYNLRFNEFQQKAGDKGMETSWGVIENASLKWEPSVYTFSELYATAFEAWGKEFEREYKKTVEHLKNTYQDEREYSTQLVDAVHDFCPDRNPKIVLAFLPPFYPAVKNERATEKERHILKMTGQIKQGARETLNIEMHTSEIFTGISDLSYFQIKESNDIENYLIPNMPAFNHVYNLPIEAISQMNVPVINIGPLGKDAHQFTERLHLPFYIEKAPYLLELAVKEALKFNTIY